MTLDSETKKKYLFADYGEPHRSRTIEILKKHPELKKLFGNTPSTSFYILGMVCFQIVLSALLINYPFWFIFIASYFVGAVINHALFVMIHECTHNLVFRTNSANQIIGFVANLPIIFPCMISFKKFHLLHHRHQGDMALDADLPGPNEAKFIGNSRVLKSLWLFFFFAIEGAVRPIRLHHIKILDPWTVGNIIIEFTFLSLLTMTFGWNALFYLCLSSIFCIGLHPLGARWVQEHFVFHEKQETYSYYGPLNKICFNVGYHNEHHDLVRVPWSKLPLLRKMAPEFYDTLHWHSSWFALLLRFIFDPHVTLFRRVIRNPESKTLLATVANNNNPNITHKEKMSFLTRMNQEHPRPETQTLGN